eukprot:COSAG02_NODE_263_length_26627_cov_47.198168_5_plen_33_part_00
MQYSRVRVYMYTQACEMNEFIRAGPTLLSMAA